MRTPDFIVPEKLHTLSLAQNAIQDLSEVHPNFLRTVRYLDMSDNKIREVRYHGHFDKSAPLQNLDLSHNNISVVQDCAFCNTSLHTLNLAFNGMNSANPDMINYVSIPYHCTLGKNDEKGYFSGTHWGENPYFIHKLTFSKSHISRNSHFQNGILSKIHIHKLHF